MGLDLYVNYERRSNDSIFYRLVGASPYTVSVRLSDLSLSLEQQSALYSADLSINNGPFFSFTDFVSSGITLSTAVPCVCSFTAQITSEDLSTSQQTICAVFVTSFPQATAIAYPTYVINESTNSVTVLLSSAYASSNGLYFYGEGHTETINLSTSLTPGASAMWFIGTNPRSLSAVNNRTSAWAVSSTTTPNIFKSNIYTTAQSADLVYPISLFHTSSQIPSSSPILRYPDSLSGVPEYYPYFISTVNISTSADTPHANSGTFFSSITARKYRFEENVLSYNTPFVLSAFALPLDYAEQYFVATFDLLPSNFYISDITATQWLITSDEWVSQTQVLNNIKGYKFPLSYDKDAGEVIPPFKTSSLAPTLITLAGDLSASVSLNLSASPSYTWPTKYITLRETVTATAAPLPQVSVYTPNYFYVKGEPVPINLIVQNTDGYDFSTATVSAIGTNSSLTLTTSVSSGSLELSAMGPIDLALNVTVTSVTPPYTVSSFLLTYLAAFEIVDVISDPIELAGSPQSFATKAPILSPNEWVTSNNVNFSLSELYSTIDNLVNFNKQYKVFGDIIGWSGLTTYNNTEANECIRSPWKIKSFDPEFFPITDSCSEFDYCKIVGITETSDPHAIIIAHENQLHVRQKDYEFTRVSTQDMIENIFPLQQIVAVDKTTDGKIVVLDAALLRVGLYNLNSTGSLIYYNSWGSFGLAADLHGFQNPVDLCVDSNNFIWVADRDNKNVKKFTANGRGIAIAYHEKFDTSSPTSVAVDNINRIHVLASDEVYVFDQEGVFMFSYALPYKNPNKIRSSTNRECMYVSHKTGIASYTKNGQFVGNVIQDYKCADGKSLAPYEEMHHDSHGNLYCASNGKLLKLASSFRLSVSRANIASKFYWPLNQILISDEEYIQPWVYEKCFHRLWDNVELLRNSLVYDATGAKQYVGPTYQKSELVIGQNEIVTNATFNRLVDQIWTNLVPLLQYFGVYKK